MGGSGRGSWGVGLEGPLGQAWWKVPGYSRLRLLGWWVLGEGRVQV